MILDVTIDLAKFCGPRTGLPLREREQLILCMFFKREISQIEALMQLRWNEETWARVLSSLFNQNEATTINVRFPPLFRIAINNGSVVIRQANKAHQCAGGHDGLHPTACGRAIERGMAYVEYFGESSPYSSGQRYHLECAAQQGLVIPHE